MKSNFLTRSTFNREEDIAKLYESSKANPNLLRERVKDILPAAIKVKATIETPGWKDVLGPMIEKKGDPRILLNLKGEMTPEKYAAMEPEIRAFNQILTFIKNLANIADLPGEEKV